MKIKYIESKANKTGGANFSTSLFDLTKLVPILPQSQRPTHPMMWGIDLEESPEQKKKGGNFRGTNDFGNTGFYFQGKIYVITVCQ